MKRWHKNLSEFISLLKKTGELKTIDTPVSTYLEISKLTNIESKSPKGGKALFFSKVKDAAFPVATNLFGSERRISLALGVYHLDELGKRLKKLMDLSPPQSIKEFINIMPQIYSMTRFFPKKSRVKTPPCQEIINMGDQVNLSKLPVLHCWPDDAGPFITLPLVFTKSLFRNEQNVGMYRLQVYNRNTTGMHWHIHKDGSHFFQEYKKAGKRMPVAVAIGADPASIYAATAPMPRNLNEMILAGFIRNRPVSMTRCLTVDLWVPTEAEFILEGYVEPDEFKEEGPFGDHTGYYSLADDYPIFHVTAITHRHSPVYCTTLVGPPPMEDCYLAKATERLFLPLIQTTMPEIKDYWFPWEGVFHNIVIVSIEKEFAGHANKLMNGLWGLGQMSSCKTIVVVDESIDPKEKLSILHLFLQRFDPDTDITLLFGPLDVLDHSSPVANFGSKIGIDLTPRFYGEPERTPKGPEKKLTTAEKNSIISDIQNKVEGISDTRIPSVSPVENGRNEYRHRILLLNIVKNSKRSGRFFAERLFEIEQAKFFNIIILYDDEIDLNNNSLILWKLFNNVDPRRDIYIDHQRVIVDSCIKGKADGHDRNWPDELTFNS